MSILSKLLAIIVAVSLVQCNFNWDGEKVSGEGPILTKNLEIDDFTAIEVSNGWKVELIPDQSKQMVVKANENLIDILKVESSNGKLSISAEDNIGKADSKLIKVYFDKKLKSIEANSASDISAKKQLIFETTTIDASSAADIKLNIKAEDLVVESSSSADIELIASSQKIRIDASSSADINIEGEFKDLKAKASSASEIYLSGISKKVDLEATSSADIDAKDLEAKHIEAKATSAGSIDCYPIDKLEAKASSGASIRYHNNPMESISSQSSSGGSIEKD